MAVWTVKQRAIAQQARLIREQTDSIDRLKKSDRAPQQLLAAALLQVNEPASESDLLSSLIARAASAVEQIRRDAGRRESLRETISQSEPKLEKLSRKLSEIQIELAECRQKWKAATADLGTPDDADPSVVLAVVERIDQLFDNIAKLNQTAVELASCNSQIESIAKQGADLVESAARDLHDTGTEPAIIALFDRLNKARTDQTFREQKIHQREQAAAGLNQATQQAQRARESLESLCRTARCQDPTELPAMEARDQKFKSIREQLHQVEQQLLLISNGQTIEQLEQQATAIDLDSLPTLLAELPTRIAALNEQRSELDQTIGSEENALRQWDGNGAAGEAAEQAQQLLAELRDSAAEFARLKLASAVLHGGIQRYRKRKQGPLLKRASELFSVLTLGAFASLQAEYNETDQPILVGVRPKGDPVEIGELSDGSRDGRFLGRLFLYGRSGGRGRLRRHRHLHRRQGRGFGRTRRLDQGFGRLFPARLGRHRQGDARTVAEAVGQVERRLAGDQVPAAQTHDGQGEGNQQTVNKGAAPAGAFFLSRGRHQSVF